MSGNTTAADVKETATAQTCGATLGSPASGAGLTFPQTFSWTTTGSCTGLSLAFATSASPSTVATLTVSGTSTSISASLWSQVKGIIGTAPTYYWAIGESTSTTFTSRTPYRAFSEAASCGASLGSPSSGAGVTFPQTFSWTTTGTCSGLVIAFSTSASPSNVATLGVSGTSTSVSASQWSQVKGIVGTAATYYWAIGQSTGSSFTARTSYRAFTEAALCSATLGSPASGATATFPQTFSWTTTGSCSGLALAFATSSSPSNVATLGVSGTSASVSASQWSQVKGIVGTAATYYWAIGESTGSTFTARTSYRAFTESAPCSATLGSPASGATATFPQTFSWTTTGSCSGLALAFATSSSPSNVATLGVSGTSTSVSASQWSQVKGIVGTAATYYWAIGESTGSTFTARTSYRAFTESAPCSATLGSPASGATATFPQTFSWTTTGSCSGLALAFATSSSPSNVATLGVSGTSTSVSASQWSQVKGIVGTAATYYWAIGESTGSTFTARTSYRAFTESAPCSATLGSPASGATATFPQTFSWTTTGSCSGLALAFATSSSPSNVATLGVSGTSASVSASQWSQVKGIVGTAATYYWAIGESTGSTFTARTSYRAFTESAPCSATLGSPASGAAATFPQTFSWTTTGSCTGLKIAFASSATPSNVATLTVSGTSATVSATQWSQVKEILGTFVTYYWAIGESTGSAFTARSPFRAFTDGVGRPDIEILPLELTFTRQETSSVTEIAAQLRAPDRRILLQSGAILPPAADSPSTLSAVLAPGGGSNAGHWLMQFESIPSSAEQLALEAAGIKLLSYVPNNAYWVSVSSGASVAPSVPVVVTWSRVSSQVPKLSAPIVENRIPLHARLQSGNIDLRVVVFKDVDRNRAEAEVAAAANAAVQWVGAHVMRVVATRDAATRLGALDIVEWVDLAPGPIRSFNVTAAQRVRLDVLRDAPFSLDGAGVTVGVWDGGAVFAHGDFGSRLTSGDGSTQVSGHATHVAGTVGGSGAGLALARGMASGVALRSFDWVNDSAEMRAAASQVRISNHSYGFRTGWDFSEGIWTDHGAGGFGLYDATSVEWDTIVVDSGLLIFKAAGNDRNDGPDYPTGPRVDGPYDTISYHGVAKNIITIGATSDSDAMTTFSSWGPTNDGRVKPDLVANGTSLMSTLPNDEYGPLDGTSMATPSAAGTAAALLQYFKRVSSADPAAATMKALLIHGARDLGRAGPDYEFGWGLIDAHRTAELIRDGRWVAGAYSNGTAQTYEIRVPAGTSMLKASLVWTDPPGSVSSSVALQNDLDLVLRSPNGTVVRPWVLNPGSPQAIATRGRNSVDNVEQVLVSTPDAGVWTIEVGGTVSVASPQAFTVVNEFLGDSFTIANPGTADLTVTSITPDQAASWIGGLPGTPFVIAPGGLRTIRVNIDWSKVPSGRTTRRLLVASNVSGRSPYPSGVYVHTEGPAQFDLQVSRGGTGSGVVTSSPAGISCGSTCSASFAAGGSVTLTAAPATGSTFGGWGGSCASAGTGTTCTVTMDASKSVSATFTAATARLTVTKTGTGSGAVTSSPLGIACGTDCTEDYAIGTSVTLTSAPTTGSMFGGWSGACASAGSAPTCTIAMDAAKSVTAVFSTIGSTSRVIRLGNSSGTVNSTVTVPVTVVADGQENGFGFSVTWNPAQLIYDGIANGADAGAASLTPNANAATAGRLGAVLTWPAGGTVTSGTRELVVLTFRIASSATGVLPIQFGNDPVSKEVSSAAASELPVADWTPGSVTVITGFESDVAPRPNGSGTGSITTTDAVQVCRFVAGLDAPAPGSEFQRADTAPRSTFGDGRLTTTDCVQGQRDAAGLDAVRAAAGPIGPVTADARIASDVTRVIAVGSTTIAPGASGAVAITLTGDGTENAAGFSVTFDPAQLTLGTVTLGSGAGGASLVVNETQKTNGRVGVLVSMPAGTAWTAGTRELVVLSFTASAGLDATATVNFGDTPIVQEVASVTAQVLPTVFSGGAVTISTRALTIVDTSIARGQRGAVVVRLLDDGRANAAGFSVVFDPAELTFVSAVAGPGANGATLITNAMQATSGRLGLLVAMPAGETWPTGTRDLVTLTFDATSGSTSGTTAVTFGDTPIVREVSNAAAAVLPASYRAGTVTLVGGNAPSITASPANATINAGQNAQFTAAATGTPTPTLRWQVSTNGGASFTNLSDSAPYSGTASAMLTVTAAPATLHGAQYRVVATNTAGSTNSASATLTVRGAMTVTPTRLRFAAVKALGAETLTSVTAAQALTVQFAGAGSVWTASTTAPWLQITSGAGSGGGQFSVAVVNPGNVIADQTSLTAEIVVAALTGPTASVTVPVTLEVKVTTAPPIGRVDSPAQNLTGAQGAIAMTGWAVDDVGIERVRIYRQCLGLDNPAACQLVLGANVVFIGDASIVAGARPDVEAAFPTLPATNAAGWGFLILSNMLPHIPNGLPNGGVGTFQLYAVARDKEGHEKVLGRTAGTSEPTTVTAANDTIAKPFGTIDTPGQGATTSGLLHNFGWTLTPDTLVPGTLVPINGSTIQVFVDGALVGTAQYNLCRGTVGNPVPVGVLCNDDVSSRFRGDGTRFRNLDAARGPIGLRSIDTTTLTNGLHTISWGVTDSANRVEGIGSRYFTVLNGGADVAADPRDLGTRLRQGFGGQASGLRDPATPIWARTGFDVSAGYTPLEPNAEGVPQVRIPEHGRVELQVPGVVGGSLIANGEVRALPIGVGIDHERGLVTWVAGPGYLGTYRLRFEVPESRSPEVDITVAPASTVGGNVRMRVDRADVHGATFTLHGWALDPQAATGAGIGTVHVWGRKRSPEVPESRGPEAPVFLGVAQLGVPRPDVAAAHGAHMPNAGFVLHGVLPEEGEWEITAYVWVTRTGRFEDARTVTVVRPPGH